jgi:uncharacterized protein (TIGR01732 family)
MSDSLFSPIFKGGIIMGFGGSCGGGCGFAGGFALLVVLFILLIIVGLLASAKNYGKRHSYLGVFFLVH